MTPLVIGSREDVAGFALAGVAGRVCATRKDVERAIEHDALLIFSHEAASMIGDTIAEWERGGRGPLFVVLPEG